MKKVKKERSITFRTSREVGNFLDKLSNKYDRSLSYVINDLLVQYLKNPPDSMPFKKKK
jgi:predicted transcriptional regulator